LLSGANKLAFCAIAAAVHTNGIERSALALFQSSFDLVLGSLRAATKSGCGSRTPALVQKQLFSIRSHWYLSMPFE
jgi:hypothetical protein